VGLDSSVIQTSVKIAAPLQLLPISTKRRQGKPDQLITDPSQNANINFNYSIKTEIRDRTENVVLGKTEMLSHLHEESTM
jgi:hypothetical protein